ncbi:PhaM family polyhydroxyalkanoate granule multifunctional regulatory protein [Rhodoferax sp. PAMC 29310]|uniref:PhaM family polyhydroxyalkanoate granule multifunctional regulatory protein n=1 Tax=Rhodoferax sp. PAMC 29310 TaxID=2822760 RepID=UPI001B32E9AA|nr:PhaM family polyhydroxyalkanoate granule multifunctional regulatory protein [Rhodoferax sp. PAMC 29310]
MSDSPSAGFGKFVPGFDFLQNLARGATETVPQMPNLGNWIAPTLNVEELDKRIQELKAVHFWLDQNSKALGATVQALEVQKMTLATLQGMNFNMGDVANAFKLKAADTLASGVQKATEKAAATAKTVADVASDAEDVARKVRKAAEPVASAATNMIDPMQLWGALTQQFQTIAASAMKDAGKHTAMDMTKNMAAGFAKETAKAAKKTSSTAKPRAPVKKAASKTVRKAPARKS